MAEDKTFLHISGDESFQSRAKSVFDGLNSLEPSKDVVQSPSRAASRGKRRRPNQVPDHVLHPEKWTKYSLEEDGSESLGRLSANEVNRHAALSFLNDLKSRRKPADKDKTRKSVGEEHCDHEKHSFSKPSAKGDTNDTLIEKGHTIDKAGVNVMPEYVVGKTKPQNKTKKLSYASTSTSTKQGDVHISHLMESDQDNHDESQVKCDKEKVSFSKPKQRCNKNIRKHRSNDDDDE